MTKEGWVIRAEITDEGVVKDGQQTSPDEAGRIKQAYEHEPYVPGDMFMSKELREKIEKGEVAPSLSMWRTDRGELEIPTITESELALALAKARLEP